MTSIDSVYSYFLGTSAVRMELDDIYKHLYSMWHTVGIQGGPFLFPPIRY